MFTSGIAEAGVNGYTDFMRYKLWETMTPACRGKKVRMLCIFGVGDLPPMSKSYELFANKLFHDYQPMALRCLEERHYNWTRDDILGVSDRLDLMYYRLLPNVRNHIPSGLEDK